MVVDNNFLKELYLGRIGSFFGSIIFGDGEIVNTIFLVTIFLWIVGLIVLYVVIFTAVKEAVDKLVVGQIIIKKYGVKEKKVKFSDEEIEKELEDEESK